MCEEIFRKYPVYLSYSVRIDHLMEKYGLPKEGLQSNSVQKEIVRMIPRKETVDWYQFSDGEKQMIIHKKREISCLFPHEGLNNSYIKIAEYAYDSLQDSVNKFYWLGNRHDGSVKKVLDLLLKSVKKAVDKIERDIDKKEDEEKSSFCTEEYIKAISHEIPKIMELCLRGKDDCWKQVGKVLVDYLEKLRFYVPEQIENSIKSDDISIINSSPEKTKDASLHGKIHYFCCLPYMINYYDDCDELCHQRMGGICTYYQYEKVKQ